MTFSKGLPVTGGSVPEGPSSCFFHISGRSSSVPHDHEMTSSQPCPPAGEGISGIRPRRRRSRRSRRRTRKRRRRSRRRRKRRKRRRRKTWRNFGPQKRVHEKAEKLEKLPRNWVGMHFPFFWREGLSLLFLEEAQTYIPSNAPSNPLQQVGMFETQFDR